ncbi:DUF1016 domain-containing protein [Testudinibacter sp. TR-2022]|uniref:PDDEXK nuclease domain-containing protein n=1 Tax=Testudinibacter sp. TR-2022 TaxID=2585029 RepID=UPI001117CD60|nr:PDDEXK nuclease domain-containing protein [Testudinibacter sp. TR-2022]TNH04758.1 DUF1016 domain-containing protein [Pasteurellaceae bacterium Phil31]TNH08638.1 DUF1016 domain-containing protein [Testudinibacter sp. TR-2022]TNH12950.1 DUF1016 domain-containing protein [Testudinibacter sp. TR-2022]TNH13423.1 DUF1016 domain-containing protein [Testudinibacter sp. TR-2022]TNH16966.1 DUF1016 domain-containing protein [Testudinibacter sp. TR-2022]
MPITDLSGDYADLLCSVKERVRDAQYNALRAANSALVELYWDLGKLLVERKADEGWGKSIVQKLVIDLKKSFPDVTGFSSSNLWRMKAFFEKYSAYEKLVPLVREISWSHNLIILERCSDMQEREFYLKMSRKFGWSKKVLIHQIENQSYEKALLGQTNFDKTLPETVRNQAKLAVKDDYLFDFLDLSELHTESALERALIAKVEDFLRAMGGMFAFMGSQYRLEVDGRDFFIDLLLFHRKLRCLIAIELKIGEFKPEYIGKMQFYLTALDNMIRQPDENPSIGIILCKEKSRTIVEYTLHDAKKPIGVATYQITRTLPSDLKGQLPPPEEIVALLEDIH